jgi:hypothetical protein
LSGGKSVALRWHGAAGFARVRLDTTPFGQAIGLDLASPAVPPSTRSADRS